MDLSSWISFWATWSPSRVALRFEGADVSYAELESRIAARAGELLSAGVSVGERVAYLGPNRPELLELLFACSRIGAIFVPLNARMPPNELQVFTRQSEPRLLFADEAFLEAARASTEFRCEVRGMSRPVVDASVGSRPAPVSDRASLIAYTSGTTGTPKGVVLTNDALLANAMNARAVFALSAADHVLMALPMFHVGGMNILTTPALIAGATVTIHRRFDPGSFLREIASARPTLTLVVPPVSLALITHEDWASSDLSSLRAVLIGSAMVTDTAMLPWFERGIPVCQVYGLTETCPTATVVPTAHAQPKRSSAGLPVATCAVSIVDPNGDRLPRGRIGEVMLTGSTVFHEYWRNPDATAGAFLGPSFRTGDAGYIDDDGFLHIVERLKDIIIVGGSNVYPADIESVLAADPRVREVAVVARPDPELGEVPAAFIVNEPGLTHDHVRALFHGALAEYKHPRDVFFVEELPKSALGKVQRSVLRAWAQSAPSGAARRNDRKLAATAQQV